MANIRYKTVEEIVAILQAEGIPKESIKVEETTFASLMLVNDKLLQKKLAKAKRPILLKKEILRVEVEKESGMLGPIFLEYYLEAFENKRLTKVRRMGGVQLDLFSDPEVALQRFLTDYRMYFDKKNYSKFIHPDQKQLMISGLYKVA